MDDKFYNGFIKHNNYELVSMKGKKVIIKANITEDSMNPYGIIHGGLIFGLGDTAMGLNCYNACRKAITLNANINYVKAGKGSFITAESKIIKEGKHICFLNANIYDEQHDLIATMESTYYFMN